MESRFWNKTNIFGMAGILAYAVTTLVLFIPFKGEPSMSLVDWQSPLGIIVIVLFFISIVLYCVGIFTHEHQLSPREAADLLESRKQYLPKLKDIVMKKTKQLESIRDLASKMSIDEYLKSYIMTSSESKLNTNKVLDILKLDTISGYKSGIAMYHNLYYEDLKKDDDLLKPMETEYDLLIAQVKDRKLKKILNELWDVTDKTNSRIIFESMMKNSKKPLSPSRKNLVNDVEKFYSRKIKPIPMTRVLNRIDDLLNGESDE